MKLTKQILKKLQGNKWVERFTDSQIIYTYKFKIEAVESYLRGVSSEEIFKDAEIPLELLKKTYARDCLKRWVKKFHNQGIDSLKEDGRGATKGPGQGRPSKRRKKLTYEELEAIVQIQTEVIETLKKKRALAQRK